ncbi:MAG: hypothetical protein E7541_02795 [Ruminococcaceae bacterium]|nr:hypothetical protein [Oscillospiraceae bacterium]
MKIPDDKMAQLQQILVKDNACVVGLKISHGYQGVGGSNSSGFQSESCQEYTVEQLEGMAPIRVLGTEICALVNDVLYFRREAAGQMQVHTIACNEGGYTVMGDSIGYDTVIAVRVDLLLKKD